VLAHLDELAPAFEIGLQPAERYFRHSELEPQAIEEEPVVDGVKGQCYIGLQRCSVEMRTRDL